MATEFQNKIWEKLKLIPKGRVTTYAYLAKASGKPTAMRAAGSACGANPHLVKVPCHRVVKSTGEVGSYAGGSNKKIALLKKEGLEIKNSKIVDLEKHLYKF